MQFFLNYHLFSVSDNLKTGLTQFLVLFPLYTCRHLFYEKNTERAYELTTVTAN